MGEMRGECEPLVEVHLRDHDLYPTHFSPRNGMIIIQKCRNCNKSFTYAPSGDLVEIE